MTNATATATTQPSDAPQADGMGGDELLGRSKGVVVGAVMGSVWAGSAIGVLSSAAAVALATAGLAICVLLIAGARRLRLAAMAIPASVSSGADLGRVRSGFALVTLGEAAAVVAAINVLVRSGRPQWIPAVICAVVGLHFVPLARLFRVRVYYASAVGLCAMAVLTLVVGAVGAPAVLWRLVPGFGAALVLWATSARLLVTTPTPAT